MVPSAHPEFAALKRVWDAKLAASGFVDAETPSAEWHAAWAPKATRRAANSGRVLYYRRAGQWLWEQIWSSRLVRRCWELHAEGHGVRVIERMLGTARGCSYRLVEGHVQAQRVAMFATTPDLDPYEPSLFEQALDGEHAEATTRDLNLDLLDYQPNDRTTRAAVTDNICGYK